MHRSNYIKILLIGMMALAMTSCTKKKAGDDNQSGDGNMILDDCSGEGYIKPLNEFSAVKVTNTAEFSYKACFIDRPSKKPLRNMHFEIEDQYGRRFQSENNEPSDDSGCVKWKDSMRYNHYAKKSGTLEVIYKVLNPALNLSKEVVFYVSPWAAEQQDRRDAQRSVMCKKNTTQPPDLIRANDLKGQASLLSEGESNDAELYINKLDFHITHRQRYGTSKKEIPRNKEEAKRIAAKTEAEKAKEKKDEEIGQVIEMEFSLEPKAKTLDRNGEPTYKPLRDGKFKVFAHLVARDTGPGQNEKMIMTNGEMGTIAEVQDGVLTGTLRTNLERKASLGNVLLVMRLIPHNFSGVKPTDVVWELGDIREFNGSRPGRLATDCRNHDMARCNYQNILEGNPALGIPPADNYERFKELHLAHPNQSLYFSTVRLRFVTIAAYPPETATRRTVTYSASTCVSDSGGLKMARMPFLIEYLDEKGNPINDPSDPYRKQTIDADDEGCLRWMANIAHEYYAVEEFMPKTVRIQMIGEDKVKVESDPNAIRRVDPKDTKAAVIEKVPQTTIEKEAAGTTISFLMNPWDDKFTFGFDLREVDPQFIAKTAERIKPESLFFTGGYGYHTIRFLYDIDNFMNLEVKKTILLEVDPRVLRYSGIVNARRTTENLRDGIYLLKIAIQKSTLDPAEPMVSIYETPGERTRASFNYVDHQEEVPRREYITTKTALVRVVDGRLIKPIELTMRDLRLMRVRANFLIELQTIDERYLQAYDTLRKLYGEERARELQEEYSKLPGYEDLKKVYGEERAKEINAEMEKVMRYRDQYKCKDDAACKKVFLDKNNNSYSPEIMQANLEARRQQTTEKYKTLWSSIDGLLRSNSFRLNELDVPEADLAQVGRIFNENDFTKQKLPDCDNDDTHCERFVEKSDPNNKEDKKPYLKARTFVGPVIFLSNAYSDAVRATDNLDEVCREGNRFLEPWQLARIHDMTEEDYRAAYMNPGTPVGVKPGEDEDGPSEPQLFAVGEEEGLKPDEKILASMPKGAEMIRTVRRQNTNYVYSPYYNALSHLCFTSVDRLIAQEKKQRLDYLKNMREVATLENYVKSFNMDFAVLTPLNKKEYPANENKLDVNEATKNIDRRKANIQSPDDLHKFLMTFDRKKASDGEVAGMCRFLIDHAKSRLGELQEKPSNNQASATLRALFGANYPIAFPNAFDADLFNKCVDRMRTEYDADSSVTFEKKLRVFETRSDNYMFKGGLQLNLNVGLSFGVSRGGSRSSSIEAIDLVDGAIAATIGWAAFGPPGAVAGALLVKPLSFKPSDSMGWSEGTSISSQTYLVAQIAKFEVELKQYEECRVLRLSPNILYPYVPGGYEIPGLNSVVGPDPAMKNKAGIALQNIFTRGVMVCSGEMAKEPKRVPENYYYFTQHFTEGDMLDQADLLNNPWLLQLRGDRDFGTFINTINAQEDVSWYNYYKGAVGLKEPVPVEWPLRKLENVYKSTSPSFPGMYTELPVEQRITAFPIDKKIINVGLNKPDRGERDINGEVCNRPSECKDMFRNGWRSKDQWQNMGSPGLPPRDTDR